MSRTTSSKVHDTQNHAHHRCGTASSFLQPLKKTLQIPPLLASCSMHSERQRWDGTLRTVPKREQEVLHSGMLVCAGSIRCIATLSCLETIIKCSKKFTKKSCLAKLRITVRNHFLISVPAIQGDFLEADITFMHLASQADEGYYHTKRCKVF